MNVALRSEHLDILSICTGGGGLDLGIGLAVPGARSVCLVEREAFAVAQLVSAMRQGLLHPAPVWSDARTFDGRRWRGCVDGLIGGIPCQPHSLAGRKQGQLDERDLWSDARRIIVQSRCWFVLIENVGGMLSAGADEVAGAERVWRDLRKLGFAVEIGLFTAAEVGASHERERVFILGVADAECDGWRESADVLQPGTNQPQPTLCGQDLGYPPGAGPYASALAGAHRRDESRRPRHAQSERRGCDLGTAKLADASHDGQLRGAEPHLRAFQPRQQTPRRRDAERCNCALVDAYAECPAGDAIGGRHDRWAHDAIGRPVERTSHEGTVGRPLFAPPPDALSSWAGVLASAPELEPAFRRVADGLASRLDVARVDRLRMLGNGVVPLQAAYAIRTLATRLAGRGSAGATRLVRMMGMEP